MGKLHVAMEDCFDEAGAAGAEADEPEAEGTVEQARQVDLAAFLLENIPVQDEITFVLHNCLIGSFRSGDGIIEPFVR